MLNPHCENWRGLAPPRLDVMQIAGAGAELVGQRLLRHPMQGSVCGELFHAFISHIANFTASDIFAPCVRHQNL